MHLKRYCCFLLDERQSKIKTSNNESRDNPWEMYTLKELLRVTKNFHKKNKIGEGGFGSVYYGRTSEGVQIAVKRLKLMPEETEMEFAIEVEVLGRVRHKNLLGLRGFYAGEDERLIVYDYMPNHSLLAHLHGPLSKECQLDWSRRMNIAIGVAEALAYLHHESSPHIIHGDINASNVLLDFEFEAKVADFGFAKLEAHGKTQFTTVIASPGYLAPESGMCWNVSMSCDVYSFGILLLEIISGKNPTEKLPGDVKKDIVEWVTRNVNRGLFNNIVDPKLKGKFDLEQLKILIMIALRCVDNSAEKRPGMTDVVDWLKSGVGKIRDSNFH